MLKFINDSVIVAHNAPFDLNFLAFQFRNMGIPPLSNFVMDTLYLARSYYNFPSNSLPNIAAHLGIPAKSFHRALQDASIAKSVFNKFIQDFRESGVSNLEKLLRLQGGTMPFPQVPELVLPPEIEETVKEREDLKIRYISRNGAETVRIIEPREVNAYWDNIYLVAFCHLRREERTFRLDRIIEMAKVR